jgi:hypothetical protein
MVPRITAVLTRLQTDWATQLQSDAILAACQEAGSTSWRDRVLTPVTTIQLFLLQILHGHTACRHLPHLSGLRFSASAYCQARSKLPLALFGLLLTRLCTSVQSRISGEGRWHGHRTFFVDGSGCSMPDTPTLVTALLDADIYRVADLAALYRQRWQVETSLAHLKTTMRMEVLPCKTVPGVLKELTVFAMVYNLVRMVMWHSGILQHIAVERISFLDALRWLSAPSTGMPLGGLLVNPMRPSRVEPRVKKRRPRPFPLMLTPRQVLRQQVLQQACTS